MFESKIDLQVGSTFYSVSGPENGTPLVLVHGATVSSLSFNTLLPYLIRLGFRVLRFDLLGHGKSECPPGAHFSTLTFTRQLEQLLDELDWPKKTMVLGYSLGAAVAASLAYRRPDQVGDLFFVAPLLNYSKNRLSSMILRGPGACWFMKYIIMPVLRRRRVRRALAVGNATAADQFLGLSYMPGFQKMIVGMERASTLDDQSRHYKNLARHEGEIFVLGGEKDALAPPAHVRTVADLAGCEDLRVLPGKEHNLIHTACDSVAQIAAHRTTSDLQPDSTKAQAPLALSATA